MTLEGSKSGNDTQESWYSTARPLVAYMTATDVIHGEGWRARAAFFMFLLAPRYLLVSSGGRYVPEYNLLYLASADLPAVGLLSTSEVGIRGLPRGYSSAYLINTRYAYISNV